MQQTDTTYTNMRKAIGFVIVLLSIAHILSQPFNAFQTAATETFNTVSLAALITQQTLIESQR
jgi:hypothetical protein